MLCLAFVSLILVTSKYGVAGTDQLTLLVLVPAHVTRCVEVFNGKKSKTFLLVIRNFIIILRRHWPAVLSVLVVLFVG